MDLFDGDLRQWREQLAPQAVVLRGFALSQTEEILTAVAGTAAQAPFRQMKTPGGYQMSVAMTNCGSLGWVTDANGYRYSATDPLTGRPWPAMPSVLRALAADAATAAGFTAFDPDACLVNQYNPGSKLSLHQDRNEADLTQPVVSVSLGLAAVFLFGGLKRGDSKQRVPLTHGDVVVWGGESRLRYHGVLPLKPGEHSLSGGPLLLNPLLLNKRINLTFRKAG